MSAARKRLQRSRPCVIAESAATALPPGLCPTRIIGPRSLSLRDTPRILPTCPVLLIHGIWDTSARLSPLRRGLTERGVARVHAMDLTENLGRAPIERLGREVGDEVLAMAARESARQVDIVGFSMGALVARWYVQRGGGKWRVRRFISVSGPQHGTATAYALPFAGTRDMRPGSALLRDLASDADPFGDVDVHCLYTPYDLMIVPARSAVLAEARSVRAFPVAMHRLMIRDARVMDHIAALLLGERVVSAIPGA